jgi:hypothetical protein
VHGSGVIDRKASREVPYSHGTESAVHIRRSSVEQLRRSSTEQKRRSSFEGVPPQKILNTKNPGSHEVNNDSDLILSRNVQHKFLSEDELYEIKQSFEVIETLWRDISLCSESIQSSVLATIHSNLGELGSELFRNHFMISTKQVTQLLF